MTRKYYILLIFLIFQTVLSAQLERSAVPIAFGLEEFSYNTYDLPVIPSEDLFNADFFRDQNKAYPYRFAYQFPVELNHNNPITPSNPWTWIPLEQGGGIWIISIYCPNALALGLNFGDFELDKGVSLIVYNETLTEVVGELNNEDNNIADRLSTIPVSGDRIFLEMYIPPTKSANIEVESVSCVYKELGTYNEADACQLNAMCEQAEQRSRQLSSTIRIISNRGTESSTGVLVNSNSNDQDPYVITSNRNLNGNPANWSFLFNYQANSCEFDDVSDKFLVSCGAEIVAESEESDLVLLRLFDNPTAEWDAYFSGWNRSEVPPVEYFSIHNAYGGTSKVASGDYPLLNGSWGELDTWNVGDWTNGRMDPGSIGAPLFDDEGLVTGFFVGGDIRCQEGGDFDHFVPFFKCWDDFSEWLDPKNDAPVALNGRDAFVEPENKVIKKQNVAIFPTPAKDHVYVFNGNDEPVERVDVYNSLGQFVESRYPQSNSERLDINNLVEGWYIFVVHLPSLSTTHKVIVE